MGEEREAARERIGSALGSAVVGAREVFGGYTNAKRFLVELADGRRVFAKAGTSPDTCGWLRREREVYGALVRDFMPRLVGWCEGERPILLLEDLSGAEHPPPWTGSRVAEVKRVLDELHGLDARAFPFLPEFRSPGLGWAEVAREPGSFLGLGLASAGWLEKCLGALQEAEAGLETRGEAFVHYDVRSDNLLFAGDGVRLFDWNHACRGSAELDTGFWLPSLAGEGGPEPEEILPGRPGVAAWVSGFFACRAGLPLIPHAPRVRVVQRFQLGPALAWVVRALGLPEPG